MINAYLRPVDEAAVLSRFSSSDGLPLVLERTRQDDRGLLSVAKIDRGHKLDTVADLVIDPATGQIIKHSIVNERGQWRDSQIDLWVREAETVLVDYLGANAAPPGRDEVGCWWQDLIAGKITRDQAHWLTRPWVAHISRVGDPVVERAIYRLYSYNLAYLNPVKGITAHSSDTDAAFVYSEEEIATDYTVWRGKPADPHHHRPGPPRPEPPSPDSAL